MFLAYTRKIIDASHSRKLLEAKYTNNEIFGLEILTEVEGAQYEILDPASTFLYKAGHKETLMKLGGLFKKKFDGFLNYKAVNSLLTYEYRLRIFVWICDCQFCLVCLLFLVFCLVMGVEDNVTWGDSGNLKEGKFVVWIQSAHLKKTH